MAAPASRRVSDRAWLHGSDAPRSRRLPPRGGGPSRAGPESAAGADSRPPGTLAYSLGSPVGRWRRDRSRSPGLEAGGQLGPVHRRHIRLALVEFARLQRTDVAVLRAREVEDDDVGVELGRGVPRRPAARCHARTAPRPTGPWPGPDDRRGAPARTARVRRGRSATLARCASRTRSSPPTSAVNETLFGAENVAPQDSVRFNALSLRSTPGSNVTLGV